MKEMINGLQFGEMILCAYEALEANKQLINDLNVFPVPDGDTGTNMCLTMSAAANEFKKAKYESLSDATNKAASALLRGARGNSGVILSLLFRGLAKSVKGLESADAQEFAQAMRAGVDAAYKAVMKPAEGTILTVARLAAAKAQGKVPSLSGIKVVDTTGAGDIFGGSALWKLLQLGKDPQALTGEEMASIARFACVAASLSTQKPGGVSSVPEYEQVMHHL